MISLQKLILNADDFSWNQENDKVIMNMFREHTISSASVIINGSNIMAV